MAGTVLFAAHIQQLGLHYKMANAHSPTCGQR
jgi:hypothetical protein